jgi:hypothetical protein
MKRYISISTLLALVVCLCSLMPSPAVAQEAALNVIVGVPQGDFGDRAEAGIGGDLYGGLRLGKSPVTIGAKLGIMIYGHETRREPFSTTVPDVTVDVTTSNDILLGHFVLRLRPPGDGAFVPYVDGLFGFKYLFTQTEINSRRFDDVASSTNFDDFALSYGGAAGLMIRVHRSGSRTAFLQLGADYMVGTEADYLLPGSIERDDDGNVNFDVQRSKTTILTPRIGVLFEY